MVEIYRREVSHDFDRNTFIPIVDLFMDRMPYHLYLAKSNLTPDSLSLTYLVSGVGLEYSFDTKSRLVLVDLISDQKGEVERIITETMKKFQI